MRTEICHDIQACGQALRAGTATREVLVLQALQRSAQPDAAPALTARFEDSALRAARHADRLEGLGFEQHPLAGLPVTVKDLYAVQGTRVRAGSRAWADCHPEPVRDDAPAVARLRATGAAILGTTHMSELAFSGLGLNPHDGWLVNPVARARGDCVPGGSSSGAAVSVAMGWAVAALGSDTGGSIRIPAALCGLVGFKSSQHRVPTRGMVPLAPAFDTACAITRTVSDAVLLDAVLSGQSLAVAPRALDSLRFWVPPERLLVGLDAPVARAFERALDVLARAGVQLMERPMPLLLEIGQRNPAPGIAALQAWAEHREVVASHGELMDPLILARLRSGSEAAPGALEQALRARLDWMARMRVQLAGVDGILCPTVPIVAPRMVDVQRPADFFDANALMLRNTFVANYLNGCAISLPCPQAHAGEEPVGLMITAAGGHDAQLLSAALSLEALFRQARAGEQLDTPRPARAAAELM